MTTFLGIRSLSNIAFMYNCDQKFNLNGSRHHNNISMLLILAVCIITKIKQIERIKEHAFNESVLADLIIFQSGLIRTV